MNVLRILIVMTAVVYLFGVSHGNAADMDKIAVLDFKRVFEMSKAGKNAKAEINRRGKAMKTELDKRALRIEESRKRLQREALVMSKEMRDKKEREIRILINDAKALQSKYQKEFKDLENRMLMRVRKEAFKLAEDMGKSGGYLLIIEKRTGEVLYRQESMDVTEKLIKLYDAEFLSKSNSNNN